MATRRYKARMAAKYASKRTRRNRNWKKLTQRKQVRNRTTVPVGLGFPKKMVMTHSYVETVTFNTGATGGLASYLFSCNSLYDPNASGTGHQPMYFDQMSALYDHYTVIGSMATIKLTNRVSNNPLTINVGAFINDDTTVTGSIDSLRENSSVTNRIHQGNTIRPTVFKLKWSAKKTFGGSILGNDDLQGNAAASPAEQSYFSIFADSSGANQQTQLDLTIEIKYIAVWDELREIAAS